MLLREDIEASVRCSLALVNEPLIPSMDPKKYIEIVRVSQIALEQLVKKRGNPSHVALYKTYAMGILYNADLFCPQVFENPGSTEESRNAFLHNLEILSGKNPQIH